MTRSIGRYTVVSRLGSGSYGNVYACIANNRSYAIKSLEINNIYNNMEEISLMTMMSHPNIAKPIEILTMTAISRVYIVMPVGHNTLSQLTYSPDPSSEDTIRIIMWQLLSALDYMHSNNIVHRDLKPGNIILDGAYVRIIDFGMSHMMHRNMRDTNYIVQTYTYRAPEVFLAQKDRSRDANSRMGTKMDIFSLGVIMYQMFTKQHIYAKGDTIIAEDELRKLIPAYEPIVMDLISKMQCSESARVVMRNMLQFDPDKRTSASVTMNMDWFSGMNYHQAELILYPQVSVDHSNSIIQRASFIMQKRNEEYMCKYASEVSEYALKLLTILIPKIEHLGIDTDTLVYLLLRIAAMEMNENQFLIDSITNNTIRTNAMCTFSRMNPINIENVYTIYRALGYNHLVEV